MKTNIVFQPIDNDYGISTQKKQNRKKTQKAKTKQSKVNESRSAAAENIEYLLYAMCCIINMVQVYEGNTQAQ